MGDPFAMKVHGYVAAWRRTHGMSKNDLDGVFAAMRAADSIVEALRQVGFTSASYQAWVKKNIPPSLAEAAINLTALAVAPDGPEAKRIERLGLSQIRHRYVVGEVVTPRSQKVDPLHAVVVLGREDDRQKVGKHLWKMIGDGTVWNPPMMALTRAELRQKIDAASIVLVLCRAEFFSSRVPADAESWELAQQAYRQGIVQVVPVRMAPVDLSGTIFEGRRGYPLPGEGSVMSEERLAELGAHLRAELAKRA